MRLRTLLVIAVLVTLPVPGAGAPADVSAALSDLMARLQLQHAKLWFAGKLSNWSLANYEIEKIDAGLDAAGTLLADPPRTRRTKQKLQTVGQAIQAKDVSAFAKAYSALTNECNDCHRASGYASIAIQVPLTLPVPNQIFVDQVAEGRALAHGSCGACHIVSNVAKKPPASSSAPSLLEIINRPSFSVDELRQFLASSHRRLGPDQAMPNPRLTEYQIEAVVAYLQTLRADGSR